MHIALTYDLRDDYLAAGYGELETAEFDRPDTIDALDDALKSLGHETVRIGHLRNLVSALARGDRWDLVFNICEGLRGAGREGQVPAVLDAYDIPYTFADPAVMAVCLHKALAKMVVRDAGLPTPRFAVVEDESQLSAPAFVKSLESLQLPLFVKPVAEGTGKGIGPESRIDRREQVAEQCADLLRQYRQPVLIEEYLPGREFTVGIVGTGEQSRCLGTLEINLLGGAEPGVYSYVNKERCEELVHYQLVRESEEPQVLRCQEIALAAWRALGCRDGGRIDLRCDAEGRPQFLEANPLAGLHPSHSDLPMLATAIGMSYVHLVGEIVDSALTRCHDAKVNADSAKRLTICREVSPRVTRGESNDRVVVLCNDVGLGSGADERDVWVQRDAVSAALGRLGYSPTCLSCDLDLKSLAQRLRELQPHAVFNLVESLGGMDRLMVLAPLVLESLEIPTTGAAADAILISSNKLMAKSRMQAEGLPTPAWYPCDTHRFDLSAEGSQNSWIIKPVWEHASVGMTDNAVVHETSAESLAPMLESRRGQTGRVHFAEQFIEGREFNLSLLDGEVLPPAEIDFSEYPAGKPRIVGHQAKWQPDSFEYQNTPRRFEFGKRDGTLLDELRVLARQCWDLFQLRGYARVDFRVDSDGRPWILEVNVNPCLSPDAGFAAALEQAGITYDRAIERIMTSVIGRSAAPARAGFRADHCLMPE
ncbi:MAG: hypothetical protein KDA60_06115 [Planctomycetales bacterium]|nr:hypothetical protein [Planctomycetales bacterium]